jgi:predicted RNase H-like HicB family nuclease
MKLECIIDSNLIMNAKPRFDHGRFIGLIDEETEAYSDATYNMMKMFLGERVKHPIYIYKLAKEDGGGYLAVVPALKGCMSDGDTVEEAFINVLGAVSSWEYAQNELISRGDY